MSNPSLFNDYEWVNLVDGERAQCATVFNEVTDILTAYGREWTGENGLLVSPDAVQREQENARKVNLLVPEISKMLSESSGAITPGMTPNLFTRDIIREGTKNYEPDLTFLDWVFQRKMKGEVETRAEWEADIEFVRIDKTGMVKYGKFQDTSRTMINHEYGAGIPIKRTWFETNTFGIQMESLAPKFRWAYFDILMSTSIYTALQAGITAAPASITHNVIRDLNTCFNELRRYENSLGQQPWGNATFRIIAPPEAQWIINAVLAMSYTLLSRETLSVRPAVTYTSKLPAGTTIYVVVDQWEQNELGQRVPFGVYGRADDIDTFAEKISYRGAWGFQIDSNSGRKLVIDPTNANFVIGGPIGTRDI